MPLYAAFGLTFESEIVCPELRPGDGTADVVIAEGSALNEVREPFMEAAPGEFRLDAPSAGRFTVTGGHHIAVEPLAGVDPGAVRLFLLGTAIGVVLHQRHVLPLHGAAVRADDGFVLVLGASGAGKSSLAAALVRRGWPAGSDDICAVSVVDGTPMLQPGYPEAKVWPDVLAMTGDDPDRYQRVRPDLEKRRVPIAEFCGEPAAVSAVILLSASAVTAPVVHPLSGGVEMTALKRNTYRPGLSVPLGAHRAHFATIAAITAAAPMWHIERPWTACPPDQLAALVAEVVGP
jgi:hypothetical protein